jgi:hypothetical protein
MEGKILQLYPEEEKKVFLGKPYRITNIIQSDYFLENYYKGEYASYKKRLASGFDVRGSKKNNFDDLYQITELRYLYLNKRGSARGTVQNLGCWLIREGSSLADLENDDPVIMNVHFHPDYEDYPFQFPSNLDLFLIYLMKEYNFCNSLLNRTRNYPNPIMVIGKKVDRKKSVLFLFQPKWENLFSSFETLEAIEDKFSEFEPEYSKKIIDSYALETAFGRREFLGLHPKDFFDFIDYSGLYNTGFITLKDGKIADEDLEKLCGLDRSMLGFRTRMPFKAEYKLFKDYGKKGVLKLLKRKALNLFTGDNAFESWESQ